jgi:beta-lactamase class A
VSDLVENRRVSVAKFQAEFAGIQYVQFSSSTRKPITSDLMKPLFAFCLLLAFAPSAMSADLGDTLKPLAAAHKGKIAIAVKNLTTGDEFYLNENEVMQTASLIKTAIMVEAYRQADAKKIDLTKMLTLKKDDKVPGAGILTDHLSDGASFTIRDAIRLMIRYSDNTATNMVLDEVGIKNVNATTLALGLGETRINAKVYKGSTTSVDPERTKKYSLGSTTAKETVAILEMIHTNKVASEESCKAMIGHLKVNDDKELLVRFLPDGVTVAHKSGATNRVRTDAGIMYLPIPKEKEKKLAIAVCVLTNENDDQRWILENAAQVTIAKIGKAVYDHYLPKLKE